LREETVENKTLGGGKGLVLKGAESCVETERSKEKKTRSRGKEERGGEERKGDWGKKGDRGGVGGGVMTLRGGGRKRNVWAE